MKLQEQMLSKRIARAGLFAALIFIFTCAALPIGAAGYIHLGDAFIFAAAFSIGTDAVFSAVIASSLADCVVPGALIYAPATAAIKGLMAFYCALSFRRRGNTISLKRVAATLSLSSLFMQIAYTSYSMLLIFTGFEAGSVLQVAFWLSFLYSFIQPIIGVPLGCALINRIKKFYELIS